MKQRRTTGTERFQFTSDSPKIPSALRLFYGRIVSQRSGPLTNERLGDLMISTIGLNRADVLAALYNASLPQGMGFLQYNAAPMERAEAETLLADGRYFDYLKGRVMKVDLSSPDTFDPWLYDRDNGPGSAERAIDALRSSGPGAVELQAAHAVGKQAAAETVKKNLHKHLHKPSTFADGVMTLGLDDVAEPLGEAVRRATETTDPEVA